MGKTRKKQLIEDINSNVGSYELKINSKPWTKDRDQISKEYNIKLSDDQLRIIRWALAHTHEDIYNRLNENSCLGFGYYGLFPIDYHETIILESLMDIFGVNYPPHGDDHKGVYISYLSNNFDKSKVGTANKLNNIVINKPLTGFWASPADAEYGWKQFCENTGMEEAVYDMIEFSFTLSGDARIITIYNLDDLEKITYKRFGDPDSVINQLMIDFDAMREEYDGIEFRDPCIGHLLPTKKMHERSDLFKQQECFYHWDCESIVIWNPDIIVPLNEKY